MWKRLSVALALVFVCGCFKVKDELTLNADGSGTVRLETRFSLPAEMFGAMGMGAMGGGNASIYPPVSESEARKFFPTKDFAVTVKEEKDGNGETVLVIEAAFKDLNALLASPYGRAHQLSLKIENNTLVLKALTGVEGPARLAEMKDEGEGFGAMMSGLADLKKKKDEMRAEFRVTLPNTVASANGTREGKTVTWTVERTKFKDAAEFAQQLGVVCEARCPADSLKLAPVTPLRLGLLPFKDLAAGSTDAGTAVDTNKIRSAAKFVPYVLQVTRALDLSGDGHSQQSGAQLIGAIVLPRELAPQKWGEAKLEEVVDAKGNDLKPGDSMEDRYAAMRHRFSSLDSEEEEEDKPGDPAETRHMVTLGFKPPDWKVNEIARIKGSMELSYFSGSKLVKLTNAIPANWIPDEARSGMSRSYHSILSEKKLEDPALAELGLGLELQTGMAQSAMMMLMFQVAGKQAALLDVQVFDADGKPWPTFLLDMGADGSREGEAGTTSCSILVAGKPKPPLSLALLASGSGATVAVPISLERVPVISK